MEIGGENHDAIARPNDERAVRWMCDTCCKTFSRDDHLKRHKASHAGYRPFRCAHCHKGFSRKDAADRHYQTHVSELGSADELTSSSNICRSCSACSKARVKCSRGRPCSYCAAKGLTCVYLPRKSYGSRGQRKPHLALHSDRESESASPYAESHSLNPATPDFTSQRSEDAQEHSFEQIESAILHIVDQPLDLQSAPPLDDSMFLMTPAPMTHRGEADAGHRSPPLNDQADAAPVDVELDDPETTSVFTIQDQQLCWIDELSQSIVIAKIEPRDHFKMQASVYDDIIRRIVPHANQYLQTESLREHQAILAGKETFEFLIQLYLDHFHTDFPFLDRSVFDLPLWGWSVCLAAAAIGCRHVGMTPMAIFGEQLCLTLHDLLHQELGFGRIQDCLPYIQARILAAVGLTQSSQPSLMRCGLNSLVLVTQSCMQLGLLSDQDNSSLQEEGQNLEQLWTAWRFRECRRRTGLFIWLTDCFLSYTTRTVPQLLSQEVQVLVPCSDELWEAGSSEAWLGIQVTHSGFSNLDLTALLNQDGRRTTVEAAARDLQAASHIQEWSSGEFATICIVHLLLRRRWEFLARGKSSDTDPIFYPPNAKTLEMGHGKASKEHQSWREMTCDRLDMLHWHTMSLSLKVGGLEGPTFLHLHLARLIVLTPADQLLGLVHSNVSKDWDLILPSSLYQGLQTSTNNDEAILTWLRRDRGSARLAVVHAGAIFWHLRRYSRESFMEPFAMFIAALVLWAFGSYGRDLPQPSTRRDNQLDEQAQATFGVPPEFEYFSVCGDTEPFKLDNGMDMRFNPASYCRARHRKRRMPDFMQLDRPMDDEMVQYFLHSEADIRLCLEGVDDLYSPDGPSQVIRESVNELTEQSKTWTIAQNYASSLGRLSLNRA